MKYFDFKYWVIGISSKCDVMDAINAYSCLIGEVNRVADMLDEEVGRRLAINQGYTVDGLQEIEADETGCTVALLRKKWRDK